MKSAAGLRCDGGKGVDATIFLYSCSSGNGDAPHVVLASLTPRMLFMADGLPGMIDVLSAAITAQPGGAVSGAAAASSAVKAQFSRQVLNARANDYSGYLQLRAAGSQAAARGNYPARGTGLSRRAGYRDPPVWSGFSPPWARRFWNWHCRSPTSSVSTRPPPCSAAPPPSSRPRPARKSAPGLPPIAGSMPPISVTMRKPCAMPARIPPPARPRSMRCAMAGWT